MDYCKVLNEGFDRKYSDILFEDYLETFRKKIKSLQEAAMSPEDQEDTRMLRQIYNKIQKRSNVRLDPEEQRILDKYGLSRHPGTKYLYSGKDYLSMHPVTGKVNLADRARKLPERSIERKRVPKDSAPYGYEDPEFIHNPEESIQDRYKRHRMERAWENSRMQQPVKNMKAELSGRNYYQDRIDSSEAKLKAEIDRLTADTKRDNISNSKAVDLAQKRINKMLGKSESLEEAANPENETVNRLIRDYLSGESNAKRTLEKMGYTVEKDDSARKSFGRDSFGDRITITNNKTGRQLYAHTGRRFHSPDVIARKDIGTGLAGSEASWHRIQGKMQKGEKPVDAVAFDYKGYLDKDLPEKPQEDKSVVQSFKQDKQFLKDNDFTAKQIDAARARMADKRAKIAERKPVKEALEDMYYDQEGNPLGMTITELHKWFNKAHKDDPSVKYYDTFQEWIHDSVDNEYLIKKDGLWYWTE